MDNFAGSVEYKVEVSDGTGTAAYPDNSTLRVSYGTRYPGSLRDPVLTPSIVTGILLVSGVGAVVFYFVIRARRP